MHDIHRPDAQGFIPGVYNYCDRRCERCRFIMQCRVGRVEADDAEYEDEDGPPGVPSTYADRLGRMMAELSQGSRGPSEDEEQDEDDDDSPGHGLSVEEINAMGQLDAEDEAEYEQKRQAVERAVKAHPLSDLGSTYLKRSMLWNRMHQEKFKAMGFDLSKRVDMAALPLPPEKLILREAVDELLWFQTMLITKLRRAVQGKVEDTDLDEALGISPLMSDWNGTAKLCLHIVERCTDAWATVAELMPDQVQEVIPMQELLVHIKAELEREFPEAHKFIRAGWDAHMGNPTF
ncbi:MAG: hypothetical protein JNN32_10070 [Flavobacteriales bacterium]|nr:hypothetical protein [Flavobacteriales bacterium]